METVKYELMVIIKPDLTQKKTEAELKVIRDFIKEHKGSIYHEDLWGMRSLAYRIQKHDTGYYAIFYFEMDPKEIKGFNRNLQLEGNLMRHLVVKTPPNYEIKPMENFEFETQPPAPKREEKKEDKSKRTTKAKTAKPEKTEKKEEKPKKTEKPKKDEKEDKKAEKLDDIDNKLQSIIDDPDIMDI